jgi:hypothetical protein
MYIESIALLLQLAQLKALKSFEEMTVSKNKQNTLLHSLALFAKIFHEINSAAMYHYL